MELGDPAGWQGPRARGWLAGQGCRALGSSHRAGGTHRPQAQWLPAVFRSPLGFGGLQVLLGRVQGGQVLLLQNLLQFCLHLVFMLFGGLWANRIPLLKEVESHFPAYSHSRGSWASERRPGLTWDHTAGGTAMADCRLGSVPTLAPLTPLGASGRGGVRAQRPSPGTQGGQRDTRVLARHPGHDTMPTAPAVGWPKICDGGFVKCLLMNVTRGRGEGRLQAGPHGRAMCMLKWVTET